MSSLPKHDKFVPGESPGEKPRGNRLARRARSFKEDFLGILSQMRSPGGSGTRAGSRAASPSSPRLTGDKSPSAELDVNVRQAQLALKHFRDVIAKNKLEMLPGNGTVVLETVTAIHVLLKRFLANEQSSTLVSATNQMYQSLAKLIKLCDDYLIVGEQVLGRENVSEVLQMVEEAIQNFVSLSKSKLALSSGGCLAKPRTQLSLETSPIQRSSLPDIPLTPRERQLLEQTAACVTDRHSHSTESMLRDSPPPKPPHPHRAPFEGFPPPLPPKKRHKQVPDVRKIRSSLENMSIRSKSPGDSASLYSESAGSLDSVLNHSREDEIRNLLDDRINAEYLDGTSSCCYWDSSSSTSNELKPTDQSAVVENGVTRLSGSQHESGFSSYQSSSTISHQRSSTSSQQFSTRSSQLSHVSQESHYSEKNTTNIQHNSSSVDGSSAMTVSNGVSMVTSQHSSLSYSARMGTADCSSCREPRFAGYILSYCPSHQPPGRIENPVDDGWRIFSPSLEDDESPPALPEKTKSKVKRERHPSQYDNVTDGAVVNTIVTHHTTSSHSEIHSVDDQINSKHEALQAQACIISTSLGTSQGGVTSSETSENLKAIMVHTKTVDGKTEQTMLCAGLSSVDSSLTASLDGNPPPLPMKKKHIMAYMEMFGNASHNNDYMRHSVHVYHTTSPSLSPGNHSLSSLRTNVHQSLDSRTLKACLPPALPPKRTAMFSKGSSTASPPHTPTYSSIPANNLSIEVSCDSPAPSEPSPTVSTGSAGASSPHNHILDMLDVTRHLIMKKPDEDGPDVRGGHPDALIIYATKAHKNDFMYQEAFLTTYRTFLSPLELTEKLIGRYERLIASQDTANQRAAREAFSLLVRVVNDLTLSDVENVMLQTLMDFVQCLLVRGDLTMAKALRVVMLNKYNAKKIQTAFYNLLPSYQTTIRPTNFSDLKSEHVAEQMTLLDAELFLKIEIPEVLIWAQEQNEERSPNLTKFTEHFNKMSYWARSRILEQIDGKEREKYAVKFIKIMKHLRKINNFNSYLALLSALDSAPIRRLEWPKHITEGLKEYCALIDSSSSFRAYRQALADTQPPCIPYIGLVLQDLTFVHIGNSNLLADESINFSKRWQQFNIVENMKKFKKGSYPFQKNERIIGYFNDFDESLSEEAMWQISEKIKPRPGKKS